MNKRCSCGNITIEWDTKIKSLIARQCDCDYCVSCGAEYVSDPDSYVKYKINDKSKHRVIQHGTETAEFHECMNCGVILVTSQIKAQTYCVLNAKALDISYSSLDKDKKNYNGESVNQRLDRRSKKWCKIHAGS